ncbi:lipopolysaccharide assembly protein LapB [Alkalimarinus alittae]|uniref:Lipopolysaccharide assembly protein B n=1 Tax=Alkalimarinus alittae TaxID=2961619 RepID=A0ABY6MYG3_9ALTE|nr:lipopolysaccharide assembly protein LapB [Alkalimarinus alittae]UZE94873.1 lipopolysaccharide assembly protein LapB [Alkalimarinus alittae]
MDTFTQWLMLVVAIGVGWVLGYSASKKTSTGGDSELPSNLKDRLKVLFETYSEEVIDSFVQSLEVNADTVGMHLSIGSHFRKSGEVEKAILVHQNLMSRPEVPKNFSDEVMFELARDYMAAGLLDRAESLFLKLKESKLFGQKSLRWLVDIYQQEREWNKAIEYGVAFNAYKGVDISAMLAHFSCEIAQTLIDQHHYWDARNKLREALGFDRSCVRATLLLAKIHMIEGHYSEAVVILRKVEGQNYRFVSEVIPLLFECSQKLNTERKFRRYLEGILAKQSSSSVMLGVADSFNRDQGAAKAVDFLAESLLKKSSLRGLDRLIDYQRASAESDSDIRHLTIVKQVTQSLLEGKPVYQCEGCGFAGEVLHWQCPSCKAWGTVMPIQGVEGE